MDPGSRDGGGAPASSIRAISRLPVDVPEDNRVILVSRPRQENRRPVLDLDLRRKRQGRPYAVIARREARTVVRACTRSRRGEGVAPPSTTKWHDRRLRLERQAHETGTEVERVSNVP